MAILTEYKVETSRVLETLTTSTSLVPMLSTSTTMLIDTVGTITYWCWDDETFILFDDSTKIRI